MPRKNFEPDGHTFPEHAITRLRLWKHGLPQWRVAKALRRSPATVSQALQGKRPTALKRIIRYLDRRDEGEKIRATENEL